MRILGIESASLVASVAIVTDDVITAEYTVNLKKTHSQTLLPMIDEIVKMLEVPLESIDAIAVSGGPGSFTGLRRSSARCWMRDGSRCTRDSIGMKRSSRL